METIMKTMKPIYDKAVAKAKAEDSPEKRRGVGIAWGGYNVTEGPEDQCTLGIELMPDGKFAKYDTWQDQGQGGDSGSLQCTLEALKELGVSIDDIVLRQNDSIYGVDSGASASSRQHYMNGLTSKMAADKLINAMKKPDGSFRTYDEMIKEGIPTRYDAQYINTSDETLGPIDPNEGIGNPTPAYTYALFLAEVEVDAKTGKTTVLSYTSVDDVGIIGNPVSVDGQAYGGLSHCIGFALSENYDDVKKHNNIAGAGIPSIKDIPDDFNLIHLQTPRSTNPYGSSGASEAFQSAGHMAVINAINNACGVRIYELPATPEKVKDGLEKLAKGEKNLPPKKFFLGSDLYEEMAYIKNNPL
jgi:aldehyde oxidoreductase